MCAPFALCAKAMTEKNRVKEYNDRLQWWDSLIFVLGAIGIVLGILVFVLETLGCFRGFGGNSRNNHSTQFAGNLTLSNQMNQGDSTTGLSVLTDAAASVKDG